MNFSIDFITLNFWVFFPLIFAFYWLIPSKWNQWRKVFLVVVSYILYMNWRPSFAIVLLVVTLITFLGGRLFGSKDPNKNRTNLIWIFSLLGFVPLLTFKYYNFVNDSITSGLSTLGIYFSLPGLNWAIPIGISFFTFQAVGYMLDVYHGRVNVEKNLLDYLLFVSFFPQISSGPISTADELMPQIKTAHKFDYEQGKQGLKYLLWGMFIKLVIADRLGLFVDNIYGNFLHYNGTTCFIASLFYSIQIYCDFAGYSLMAIGVAGTLGFNLINNFRKPYLAISITDFWKRWHISLTRWLTRQIYIPLGGNRCSKTRNYWNIFVTFLVSGIWHGANWTFIIWGVIHGVLLIIEKAFGWHKYDGNKWVVCFFRVGFTFLFVTIAWVFFRMPDITSAFMITERMVTDFGMPNLTDLKIDSKLILLLSIPLLLFKDLREEYFPNKFILLDKSISRWIIYIVLFVMILSLGKLDSGQFIYASF